MITTMKVQLSFMTSGPSFTLELPSDFEPVPELSSPLENGRGGRSFDFLPSSRDSGQPEGTRLLDTFQDPQGHSVEWYLRLEEPLMWWLRWRLADGYVYTHLREEDGEGMAKTTVESLEFVENQTGGTPFLLPSPPLTFAASSRPGYQERAIFVSSTRGPGWSVELQRPGHTPEGRIFAVPEEFMGDRVAFRAGVGDAVDAWIWGVRDRAEARVITEAVVESFGSA